MNVGSTRHRIRRTGLITALAATMVVSAVAFSLSGAGPAAADPPEHAYDNHAASNASPNDNCVLDCQDPAPPPPPKPSIVKITPQAAKVFDPSKYEGILPCGASATEQGDGAEPDVNVERLADAATSGTGCSAAPYALTNTDNALEFIKADGQPFAQFFLTVVWPSDNGDIDAKQTGVDFGLVSGGYEFVMPWCPVSLREGHDESAAVVGLPEGATAPTPAELSALGITDMDGLPRAARVKDDGTVVDYGTDDDNGVVQYACLGSRSVHVVPASGTEGAYYAYTEEIYLLGDVKMRTL